MTRIVLSAKGAECNRGSTSPDREGGFKPTALVDRFRSRGAISFNLSAGRRAFEERTLRFVFSELALDVDALESFELLDSFAGVLSLAPAESLAPESLAPDSFVDESLVEDAESVLLGPFVDDDDDLESVTYQPLPLNTMPTG